MISRKVTLAVALLCSNGVSADWIVFKKCTEVYEGIPSSLHAVIDIENKSVPKLRMFDDYLSPDDGWITKWLTTGEVLEVKNAKGWTYKADLLTGRIYDGTKYHFCEKTTVVKQKTLLEKLQYWFN